jgi:hypothetical protein
MENNNITTPEIIEENRCTILFRSNLSNPSLPFDKVNIDDFKFYLNNWENMLETNVLIFVDIDGRTKILRNRYGFTGSITKQEWIY